jgi:hypothetical protein
MVWTVSGRAPYLGFQTSALGVISKMFLRGHRIDPRQSVRSDVPVSQI